MVVRGPGLEDERPGADRVPVLGSAIIERGGDEAELAADAAGQVESNGTQGDFMVTVTVSALVTAMLLDGGEGQAEQAVLEVVEVRGDGGGVAGRPLWKPGWVAW